MENRVQNAATVYDNCRKYCTKNAPRIISSPFMVSFQDEKLKNTLTYHYYHGVDSEEYILRTITKPMSGQ